VLKIYQVKTDTDIAHVRDLFWEYLQWANSRLNEKYGINLEIEIMLEQDMAALDKFAPPSGRLLLAEYENQIAGLACMRQIRVDIAEIKRMFVRPYFRSKGIGRALLDSLLVQAREIGYPRVRLDSTRFMKTAHVLYQSLGFQDIDPYEESEIPPQYWSHWRFMEKQL
jgi:GNAT superfamily N-acetyltransferase